MGKTVKRKDLIGVATKKEKSEFYGVQGLHEQYS